MSIRRLVQVARDAALSVDGVDHLVPLGLGWAPTGSEKTLGLQMARRLGADVTVSPRGVAVSLRVAVRYGVRIPAVAEALRMAVADYVAHATECPVVRVDVDVVEIVMA